MKNQIEKGNMYQFDKLNKPSKKYRVFQQPRHYKLSKKKVDVPEGEMDKQTVEWNNGMCLALIQYASRQNDEKLLWAVVPVVEHLLHESDMIYSKYRSSSTAVGLMYQSKQPNESGSEGPVPLMLSESHSDEPKVKTGKEGNEVPSRKQEKGVNEKWKTMIGDTLKGFVRWVLPENPVDSHTISTEITETGHRLPTEDTDMNMFEDLGDKFLECLDGFLSLFL